jgi:cytochrome c
MSKIIVTVMAVIATCIGIAAAPQAYASGTAAEAEELARKAVVFVKTNGISEAIETFNKMDGDFVKDDLYVFMFRVSGKQGARVVALAHPVYPGLIGKDLCNPKYPDVKHFIAAMAVKAMKKNCGWVDYEWSHPKTNKIVDKSSYVLPAGPDIFVGCGVYR